MVSNLLKPVLVMRSHIAKVNSVAARVYISPGMLS